MSNPRTLTGTWKIALSLCCVLHVALMAQESVSQAPAPAEEVSRPLSKDMLLLTNGDQISGILQSFQHRGHTLWHRSDIHEPFRFLSDGVDEIMLGDRAKPQPLPRRNVTLRLNNGDTFSGEWQSLNATNLILNTAFAGTLQIPRDRWQWAVFQHSDGEYLYEGPTGLEGWTMGEVNTGELDGGDWAYRNGAFYALKAASIARMIGMPDRMRLEFDMEWKGSLNLAVALYTDYLQPVSLADKDSEPDFGGFYSLQLTSYAVNVLMVKQKEPLQYLGMTQTPVFRQATKAHVDVRTNKANQTISLLVNGKLVKRWVDQGGFAGEGNGIRLVHQGQGALRFSNLKISAWDGKFEQPPTNRPQATVDLLTLRNGDRFIGSLEESTESRIQFKIGETVTELEFDRIAKIELGGLPDATRPLRHVEVLGTLVGGGQLQFLLESVQDDVIQGTSEIYGPISMRLPLFEKLDFQRVVPVEKP